MSDHAKHTKELNQIYCVTVNIIHKNYALLYGRKNRESRPAIFTNKMGLLQECQNYVKVLALNYPLQK